MLAALPCRAWPCAMPTPAALHVSSVNRKVRTARLENAHGYTNTFTSTGGLHVCSAAGLIDEECMMAAAGGALSSCSSVIMLGSIVIGGCTSDRPGGGRAGSCGGEIGRGGRRYKKAVFCMCLGFTTLDIAIVLLNYLTLHILLKLQVVDFVSLVQSCLPGMYISFLTILHCILHLFVLGMIRFLLRPISSIIRNFRSIVSIKPFLFLYIHPLTQ